MEKNTYIKLMNLKSIKEFGNSKVIKLICNLKNINSVYGSMEVKHPEFKENFRKFGEVYDICKKSNIALYSYFDKEYPSKLRKISSPPLVIFTKGELELVNRPAISIVGTRSASIESLNWTLDISKKLSALGYVIVSGGAKGIDAAAHKGALETGNNTICVLGSGLNNIYPEENIDLINKIMDKGLVVSEYPPLHHVSHITLLERNRITSGLGDLIVVAASREEGGAMSQVKVALSQNKRVFCPHPDLNLKPNGGILKLIRENKAIPFKNIEEIEKVILEVNSQIVLTPFV